MNIFFLGVMVNDVYLQGIRITNI